MAIELKVPSVGESITEVMIGEWLHKVGDFVAEGEAIVVIETDKVNVEIVAPKSGTVTEILKGDEEDAEVGEVVGYMEEGEPSANADPQDAGKKDDPVDTESVDEESTSEQDNPDKRIAEREDPDEDAGSDDKGGERRIMPAAARALKEKGLSADEVKATGPGGRLLKEDVLRHAESASAKSPPSASGKGKSAKAPAAPAGDRSERSVKMTPLRRRIASRLVEAQQDAAILTTFNEIDMSAVIALRKQYQESFVGRHGIKLGFMSFFVKAAVEALKEVPVVNAQVQDQNVVYYNYYDIGVAVGGGKGLVVPVIRNAERLGFAEVEQTIAELAGRAKNNTLKLEELQGGTFTISNGGIYGSLLSTPIINPPQSGILGLHKIEERPVAINGQVVVRPMMYVALSYDHRIIDGREAVTFLVKLKERIEDPTRILLEV